MCCHSMRCRAKIGETRSAVCRRLRPPSLYAPPNCTCPSAHNDYQVLKRQSDLVAANPASSAPITPEQLRIARALLSLTRYRLAVLSKTTVGFIYQFEKSGRVPRLLWRSQDFDGLASIRSALEQAGVEFIELNGDGAGVQLAKVVSECITPEQVRAARVLLKWSRDRLAALSETTEKLICQYESEGKIMKPRTRDQSLDALGAIRNTLEVAGVTFTDDAEPGVKLRPQPDRPWLNRPV